MIWASQHIPFQVTSDATFWALLRKAQNGKTPSQRETEWRRNLVVRYAIWLHQNERIFKGRAASTDWDHSGSGGISVMLV